VNRGEIWWVERPDQKRRPFLVLTRNPAIPVLESVLAVPVTSTVRSIPTEVPLDERDGMPKVCALSFDNVETLPKWSFVRLISTLSEAKLDEACAALNRAAGCE
jgi:mRNA interferase MazF